MLIGTYTAKYIGKTMLGFKSSHEYLIKIGKDEYCYGIEGVVDLTEDEDTTAYITYASEKSIRQNWEIKEDKTQLN
jgi:uncharacterized cupin superfamily protein